METKGKIVEVFPLRSGTTVRGDWQIQEYLLEETGGEYPNKICFSVSGEKIRQFGLQVGDEVIVSFFIYAKRWKDKWFNSLRATDVRPVEAQPQSQEQPQPQPQPKRQSIGTFYAKDIDSEEPPF